MPCITDYIPQYDADDPRPGKNLVQRESSLLSYILHDMSAKSGIRSTEMTIQEYCEQKPRGRWFLVCGYHNWRRIITVGRFNGERYQVVFQSNYHPKIAVVSGSAQLMSFDEVIAIIEGSL